MYNQTISLFSISLNQKENGQMLCNKYVYRFTFKLCKIQLSTTNNLFLPEFCETILLLFFSTRRLYIDLTLLAIPSSIISYFLIYFSTISLAEFFYILILWYFYVK